MAVKEKSECLRVAVVEDIRDTREALAFLINQTRGMMCVAAVASAEEALILFPTVQPEVVLLDIQLAGEMNGTDCIKHLRDRLPAAKIVMLTASQDAPTVGRCLMRGAVGYLHKSMSPERIPKRVQDAAAGYSPMSPEIARFVMGVFQSFDTPNQEWEKVSPREREVLELLTHGFLKKEIADRLGISEETVRTHCSHIYEKLHVNCREHAVAKAIPLEVLGLMKGPAIPGEKLTSANNLKRRKT